MLKTGILSLLMLLGMVAHVNSQEVWLWNEIDSMPMRISNNAVTYALSNNQQFVYSFGGIDSTKLYSGITRASFRYDVAADSWEWIDSLPDTLGKIASAASTVKNKIYIIGGYHVFAIGNEISSDRVHIFDPDLNVFLADGAKVPVPIDDHVQAVWRDKLIYVVTGWSQNTNVANVQIYNPAIDSWMVGTPVPTLGNYKVFGASGVIHADTIYYTGGARIGTNFPLVDQLRKGVIDPANPTQITWTTVQDSAALGYRMAAESKGKRIYWFGGSSTSYNFNGIAYNGTGGVLPLTRIVTLNINGQTFFRQDTSFPAVMDMRGIANINTGFIVAGGMVPGPAVSNKTYLIKSIVEGGIEEQRSDLLLYPNPFADTIWLNYNGTGHPPMDIRLYSMSGILFLEKKVKGQGIIDTADLPNGLFIIVVEIGGVKYIRKGIKYPR